MSDISCRPSVSNAELLVIYGLTVSCKYFEIHQQSIAVASRRTRLTAAKDHSEIGPSRDGRMNKSRQHKAPEVRTARWISVSLGGLDSGHASAG
jgi:hypothetical protein